MTKPSGPLAGVTVLELTSVLFGPYASQTLGDWGAEVIKIEPLTGDTWRYSGQFRNRGMTGQFMAVNRNKRSLALDLKQPDGKSVLQRLIATADVLLTNIRPAALGRLGFGYEACQQINPRLVYAAATGFGQDGPWAARPAFDEVIQASSGFASAMGSDDEPAFVPSLVADKICGLTIVGAVSAALVHRERTGAGQAVDVSLMDSMLNLLVFECQEAQFPSKRPRPVYVPMKSTDGHVIIAPISQKNFEQMTEAMQQPELKTDARFATGPARVEHWTELMAVMEQWTRRHSSAEIEAVMDANSVPCSRFVTVADAMKDTQLAERGSLSKIKDAAGEFIVPNAPFQFTTPTAAGPAVASLGADNTSVLSEILGLSETDIDALRDQGVLST